MQDFDVQHDFIVSTAGVESRVRKRGQGGEYILMSTSFIFPLVYVYTCIKYNCINFHALLFMWSGLCKGKMVGCSPSPGSYIYTITERKMVSGKKVESVRPLSVKEYEV